MPRILIVAQNASSKFGGEAFLPVKYFQLLRRRGVDAQLIAHSRNRADLLEILAPWADSLHFVEDSVWHKAVWQVSKPLNRVVPQSFFSIFLNMINEVYQRRIIRSLVSTGKIDLIHQPVPVAPKAPSAIHGFGVPVIIGPMNGGMCYPPGYEDYETLSQRAMVSVGRYSARLINRLIPGKRRAAMLLVANARTREALPLRDHPRVVELVENGVDLSVFRRPEIAPRGEDDSFRLVFMGRLVDWKAVDLTIAALGEARRNAPGGQREIRLDIIGSGPEQEKLEAQVQAAGLGNAVRFHGLLPQKDCIAILAGADAFILNSVWECGGAVVLEAMSLGIPVIASDWGGPADYLDPSCGILVPPAPRESFVQRLADAIGTLAADPDLCRRLGAAGAAKVRAEYDWDRKVDRILELYAIAAARS